MERLGLSFHNVDSLHEKLDRNVAERAGSWNITKLVFEGNEASEDADIFTIRHRDPVEAIKSLWRNPELSPQMVFSPQKVFSDRSQKNRIFSEMWTGKWWNAMQVSTSRFIPRTQVG